jgi:hypothetical protein
VYLQEIEKKTQRQRENHVKRESGTPKPRNTKQGWLGAPRARRSVEWIVLQSPQRRHNPDYLRILRE